MSKQSKVKVDKTKYKLVLGLEIHMHLTTQKKMFCGCSTNIYSAEQNTHTCPVCLGLPGALPVPNFNAIRLTQMLGLALGCNLNTKSRFDRKHYFYPDLPKGYQISQYKYPLCEGNDNVLERIHLEEDTAKSFHQEGKTLINFNKSGMPLIEIVTKPVFTSVSDAVDFARNIRDTAKLMEISNADMQKGQMRIEPNISVRTADMAAAGELPSYKVEVKNINSFKFMEKAVNYEYERQSSALEEGKVLVQENRGYDETKNITVSQRSKEEAKDYRYFPDPDIPPMGFDDEYLKTLQKKLPETPQQLKNRLLNEVGLSEALSEQLSSGAGLELVSYFEEIRTKTSFPAKKIAKLLLNKTEYRNLTPAQFEKKLTKDEDKLTDSKELENIAAHVISVNADPVAHYKAGKENVLQFLVGQMMKESRGKADPKLSISILEELLK